MNLDINLVKTLLFPYECRFLSLAAKSGVPFNFGPGLNREFFLHHVAHNTEEYYINGPMTLRIPDKLPVDNLLKCILPKLEPDAMNLLRSVYDRISLSLYDIDNILSLARSEHADKNQEIQFSEIADAIAYVTSYK